MKNLMDVSKPVRYIGHEWNAVLSKPEASLRFAFTYPDVYEVGMSYLGLQILYGLLNEQPWIWCERCFCPWPDLEQKLRESGDLLATLESQTPLRDMDIVGFSLQHEMLYTNVLAVLELGGIPVLSRDRTDEHPLVLAGGPCAYNPMPMTDFIDAFVIGEGEDVILELCEAVQRLKDEGASRAEMLLALGKIEGIYVPSLYETLTNRKGEQFHGKPKFDGIPDVVKKRLVTDFENSYYPTRQVVPNTKIIHHRLALEVMRGCPGGCRFCQAGYTDRPVRERSPERLMRDAEEGLKSTGLDEVGLLSLSTADYTQLPGLCSGLMQKHYPQRVALSLPSLRIDSFPSRVTQEIGKVRSTGLTFAPEAGTERLRWAINKLIYDAEIYAKIRESVNQNQDTIKFYFMVGLPTETDEDLQGIVDTIQNIKKILREAGKRRAQIHVGLSPFVPKPHTAYQWYGQIPQEEIRRRVHFVSDRLKPLGVKINWHDPQKSLVEGALSRADARVGAVIRTVYERGGRFDEWQEYFNFSLWEEAFQSQGLSLRESAAKTYEEEDALPWDPISIRVSPRYLWKEWEKTFRDKESRHCGHEMCRVCKVCDGDEIVTVHAQSVAGPKSRYNMEHDLASELAPAESLSVPETETPDPGTYRYRLQFAKTGGLIYASHHDLMQMFQSVCRRAGIQLAFSEGFHPHPKIVFASALPVGTESRGDYVEITTVLEYDPVSLSDHLNAFCPEGFCITRSAAVAPTAKKVTALAEAFEYHLLCGVERAEEDVRKAVEAFLRQEDVREELHLYHTDVISHSEEELRIVYVCRAEGGQYTKAEAVVEKIRTFLDQPVRLVHTTRNEMLTRNERGEWQPLINPL